MVAVLPEVAVIHLCKVHFNWLIFLILRPRDSCKGFDDMKRIGYGAVFLLTSCMLSSRSYVEKQSGFAILKGEVVHIENLNSVFKEDLIDGNANHISAGGARITMKFGEEMSSFEPGPGSVLVLSRHGDYLLQPHRQIGVRGQKGEPVKVPGSIEKSSSGATQNPEVPILELSKGGDEDTRLVEHALSIIQLTERGSIPEVAQHIDQLAVLFPGNKSVELFQIFLTAHLSRLEKNSLHTSTQKDALEASRSYEKAGRLQKENRIEEAFQAFESAYSLDPENPQIISGFVSFLKQMGLDLYSKGKWKEAVVYWKRVLEIRPSDVEARRFLKRAEAVNQNL